MTSSHPSTQFPVPAERDHVAMLASVTNYDSEIPSSLNQGLSLLLHELLHQNPLHRLRYLHHFQVHPFFRGVAFDPELLQKHPVNFVLETQAAQSSPSSESMFFKDFDCNLESFLVHPRLAWAPLLELGPIREPEDFLHCQLTVTTWWSVCFHFVASYHSVPLGVEPEFRLGVLLLAATMP